MRLLLTILIFTCNFIAFSQQTIHVYDKANRLTKTESANQKKVFYYYDQNGNRTKKLLTIPIICSGATAFFHAGTIDTAYTYQWQVNTGSGFVNINNDAIYSGVTTHSLVLSNPQTSWYGYKYRCLINGVSGQTFSNDETLKFTATWIGTVSTAWENPANWGCSKVPDGSTDVFINAGTPFQPIVSSNTSVRSMALEAAASWIVASGFEFKVLH
jgi:YD repeat-containing protein